MAPHSPSVSRPTNTRRHLHLVRIHVDGGMPSDRLRASGAMHQQSVFCGDAGEAKGRWPMMLMSVELERVKGIEPSYSAWKAAALPLSYPRIPSSTNTALRRPQPPSPRGANRLFRHPDSAGQALNARGFARYISSPTT